MDTAALISKASIIEQLLAESGGELDSALEDMISSVSMDVDTIAQVSGRLLLSAGYWKEKADKASALAKALRGVEARLKDGIKQGMIEKGMKELRGTDTRFVLTSAAPRLVIDEALIPQTYQVVSYSPDKPRIKEALTQGKEIPGASLEGGYALREYPNRS